MSIEHLAKQFLSPVVPVMDESDVITNHHRQSMTNPLLTEPAVLALMRAEQKRLADKAEEKWLLLKVAEESMKPYKDAYDKILNEWSQAQRLADSVAEVLKANEPKAESEQEVA